MILVSHGQRAHSGLNVSTHMAKLTGIDHRFDSGLIC